LVETVYLIEKASQVGWASVYLPTNPLLFVVGNDKPVAHPT